MDGMWKQRVNDGSFTGLTSSLLLVSFHPIVVD
jgi:hypothetical protein